MIPPALSGETHQDSEPFLAVDLQDPQRMVASAFTPNPFGTTDGTAPVYITADGGETWELNNIVPSAGGLGTSDITVAASTIPKTAYGGILRVPGDLLLNLLRAPDFTSPATMTVLGDRSQVDQPFIQVKTVGIRDRIYVGNNDLGAPGGRTATVDVSLDGGATFTPIRIEWRSTGLQNGPSVRPTIANDGTVYVAYFGWRIFRNSVATSDIVVVRDDQGAAGSNPFQHLTDPSDGQPGRIVAGGVTIPWLNARALGNERIGSTLSIAVDPNQSGIVYVAWADRVGNGDIYTIHVRRSVDRGGTWSNDLRTIRNATCCSVAVAANGTVGLLYQQFVESNGDARWVVHLEQSRDGFQTREDRVLANVPGASPTPQFLPYLGDYNFLLSVGNEFRGVFSANNTPDPGNFPQGVRYQRPVDFRTKRLLDGTGRPVAESIDPFFFKIPVAP
ncbi:MAG: hypothetical protein HY735_14125 [Verrucomicrobia bacterium]|nr:hypothetical protein [Verrucomicrobiota bacterium]